MYIDTLRARNFTCFKNAELVFQFPGRLVDTIETFDEAGRSQGFITRTHSAPELPNVNIILGDNGAGKTSVLRAVALSILAPILADSGFVPYRLVRRTAPSESRINKDREAQLILSMENNGSLMRRVIRIEQRRSGNLDRLLPRHFNDRFDQRLYEEESLHFFLAGFGATRHIETGDFSESSARKVRGVRYQRVATLFEDNVPIRPLQSWFKRLKSMHRQTVVRLINKILPSNIRFTGHFEPKEGQLLFQFEGSETPFNSLSDGYKAFLGWAGELIGQLSELRPYKSPTEIEGIVLVDEIDLHLHPEWQRQVVPTVARAFPKLQFIFTTHSPIVTSTVHKENIFVADFSDDHSTSIRQLGESTYGRSVEQILLSSYFNLASTRPEAFRDEARTLFVKAAKGDEGAALAYLERLTGSSEEPNDTSTSLNKRSRSSKRRPK